MYIYIFMYIYIHIYVYTFFMCTLSFVNSLKCATHAHLINNRKLRKRLQMPRAQRYRKPSATPPSNL